MTALKEGLPLDRSRPIMAIGDVHSMPHMLDAALEEADAAGAFPVLLGDLVDKGPDSVGVLRRVLPRIERRALALVRGNHDERLLQWIANPERKGKASAAYDQLIAAEDADELSALAARVLHAAPYWISLPGYVLVHGAFHPDMLACPSRGEAHAAPQKLRSLALFAETAATRVEGLPVRTYAWIASVPSGLTVLAGHDTRRMDQPLVVENQVGGKVVFLDTGAAKGGRLSSWLIPPL